MEQPRILVIGSNGQVGYELRRTLAPIGDVTAVDFPQLDLGNEESIRYFVGESSPHVVINAAAYTAVDKAEAEPGLCRQINGVAPGILAQEARKLGALLIHYSTDYVFDGTKEEAYTEQDRPNPLNAYGRSKLEGDLAVGQSGADHLIFRLCWVYGARGQNFMLTILRLAREHETLRIVADQSGAPTWSRMIAETTAFALRQVLAADDRKAYNGTYHLAAAGCTSWHGFANAIVNHMEPTGRKCKAVQPITTPEYPLPAQRPARSVLCCEKLQRTFRLRLPHWEESLKTVLERA